MTTLLRTITPPARDARLTPATETVLRARFTGIEGLRGIAALSVLVFHVQNVIAPSSRSIPLLSPIALFDQGVTLFFVLSGFLLYLPFARSLLRLAPAPGVRSYFVNRGLRILPAYVFVLIVTSLVLRMAWLPRETDGAPTRFGTMTWFDTITASLMLQGYTPRTVRSGLEAAWTLSVEVAFYVALPVLFALAARMTRRRSPALGALLPPLALLVLGVAGKVWLLILENNAVGHHTSFEWGANWTSVAARSLLVNADLFAFGMFVAVVFAAAQSRGGVHALVRGHRLLAVITVLVGVSVLTIGCVESAFESSAYAVFFAAVLVTAVSSRPGSLRFRILESRLLRQFGLISFSIYLWHLPVIRWLQYQDLILPDTFGGFLANLVLVGSITLALAWVTHRLIEAPALTLKRFLVPPSY